MSTIRITTPFNIDVEFTSPPFYRRLFAWFIDVLVQVCYLILALRLYDVLEERFIEDEDGGYILWATGLILVLPFLVYHLFMELTMDGQSIGKKIMSMKVISDNCGRPTAGQYIIRWLLRTSDYSILLLLMMLPFATASTNVMIWGMAGTMLLFIADVILVNTGKQQRLGDIVAHTYLVNTESNEQISNTIFLDVEEAYQPSYPQVLQLSDKDLNALKNILDTSVRRADDNLLLMAAEKIKNHLNISTSLEPKDFLETLLKDYNALTGR